MSRVRVAPMKMPSSIQAATPISGARRPSRADSRRAAVPHLGRGGHQVDQRPAGQREGQRQRQRRRPAPIARHDRAPRRSAGPAAAAQRLADDGLGGEGEAVQRIGGDRQELQQDLVRRQRARRRSAAPRNMNEVKVASSSTERIMMSALTARHVRSRARVEDPRPVAPGRRRGRRRGRATAPAPARSIPTGRSRRRRPATPQPRPSTNHRSSTMFSAVHPELQHQHAPGSAPARSASR